VAEVGVQITKNTLFRGVQQEFHNIYHYRDPAAVTIPAEAIIDEIVAREKEWHSTVVNFIRAAAWSSGGTQAENQMIFQKNLSGVGASANDGSLDRERAVLIRWPAGFDVRGLPVYLRKWYHTCGQFGTVSITNTGTLSNTQGLTTAMRNSIANLANALDEVGVGEAWNLCSRNGRERTGSAQCHPFLEHHQLGDAWR
jgi:hypothetical protein